MHETLTIQKEILSDGICLHITGRIDAYWSQHLDESLDEVLRAGHRNIGLDLLNVNFLSSPGIRILLRYYKLLKQTGGKFYIGKVSVNLANTLKMTGLDSLIMPAEQAASSKGADQPDMVQDDGACSFRIRQIHAEKTPKLYLYGDPDKFREEGYQEADSISLQFDGSIYGAGIGALGESFDDCRERFGELIGLGHAVACLPADRPNSPDYLLKTGEMIPEVTVLYGFFFEHVFNFQLQFTCRDEAGTLPFGALLEKIREHTGQETFTLLMLAETSGMVGSVLRKSPAGPDKPQAIFSFPEIREYFMLTPGPEYAGSLALIAGVATTAGEGEILRFTRPKNEQSGFHVHFHAAVFQYLPLSRDYTEPDSLIRLLFSRGRLLQVMHLLDDDREGTGAGESAFRYGSCWIGLPQNITRPQKGGRP
ncbi:MAG TPA: STAS domain-containing protein [Bacteroidales bacterium]|nr:STAS domain-containing protein [Bacteroidales bacterium]HSA42272.1 STAS domain-containing protein [Bacteroidales bacterium]